MLTVPGDLRYGVRLLLATPRVTMAALLSLALGIGATAAIFTVVNAVILRPLPFNEPDRLVAVWETSSDNDRRSVAPANFLDWRRDARAFTELAAYDRYGVSLTGRERPERLRSVSASGNMFSMLGVQALRGRAFTGAHDAPGAAPEAMLSHGAWQRLLGGDPRAVGARLVIDNQPRTLIGVLPPSFDFFGPDVEVVLSGDRGVPSSMPLMTSDPTKIRDAHIIYVIGRLRPGVSVEQAQAEMSTIMRRLERTYPHTNTGLEIGRAHV